jgi:hypothetical protein
MGDHDLGVLVATGNSSEGLDDQFVLPVVVLVEDDEEAERVAGAEFGVGETEDIPAEWAVRRTGWDRLPAVFERLGPAQCAREPVTVAGARRGEPGQGRGQLGDRRPDGRPLVRVAVRPGES